MPTPAASLLRWYHALIAVLNMLGGVSLVTIGVVLKILDPIHNLRLSFTASSTFNTFYTVAYIGIFAGISLITISIVGMCSVKLQASRLIVFFIYLFLCLITISGLIFLAVIWLNIAGGNTAVFDLENRAHKAWQTTVEVDVKNACDIQKRFKCNGFSDGECLRCSNSTATSTNKTCAQTKLDCPDCPSRAATNSSVGCFGIIFKETAKFYRPAGIISCAATALMIVDMIAVFFL